jgi:hypothetical protein
MSLITAEKSEVFIKGNVGEEGNMSSPNRYIRCPDCGEQILMVPVLSQMIESIENHLSTHKDHSDHVNHDPIQHPKTPCINEDLADQVLIRAAEIGGVLSRNQTWVNTE